MQTNVIAFNLASRTQELPKLQAGDVVKIHRRIKEGAKERTQLFQGSVIAIKGGQSSSPTITVRKVSFGVGVELIFPLYSAQIEKIELLKRVRSRRAKLYFVRDKSVKLLSRKLKEVAIKGAPVAKMSLKKKAAQAAEEKKESEAIPTE